MSKKILSELKKYQKARSEEAPFESHNDFLKWSDSVSPLLNFDENIKNKFSGCLLSTKVTHTLSPKDYINNANECVGIVNEAIQQLEHNISPFSSQSEISGAELNTFQTIFFKSALNVKVILLSVIIAAFGAGVTLGQSKLYSKHIAPLIIALGQSADEP